MSEKENPTPLYDNRHAFLKFQKCDITITRSRWDVSITVTFPDGTEQTYMASADSYFTESDEIWFGTKEEHENYGEY